METFFILVALMLGVTFVDNVRTHKNHQAPPVNIETNTNERTIQ